jgi:hypothetical protein
VTHLGYVLAGWSIGLGTLGAYAYSVLVRGRSLARRVPEDRRRWMTADDEPATESPR